jgi:hypothetical protein
MSDGSRLQRTYVHTLLKSDTLRVQVYEGTRWAGDVIDEVVFTRAP